jgi:hypothetical protein
LRGCGRCCGIKNTRIILSRFDLGLAESDDIIIFRHFKQRTLAECAEMSPLQVILPIFKSNGINPFSFSLLDFKQRWDEFGDV